MQKALCGFVDDHFPKTKLEFCSMMRTKGWNDQDAWNRTHVVCCDSLSLTVRTHVNSVLLRDIAVSNITYAQDKLWVDSQCRAFEKPFLFSDQGSQAAYLRTFIPHASATFSESLVPNEKRKNPQLFVFDHLPSLASEEADGIPRSRESGADDSQNDWAEFEIGAIVTESQALFSFVFSNSIALAVDAFASAVTKSSNEPLRQLSAGDLWGVWSVVQRGHNATTFESCIMEAWKICELLPMLLQRLEENGVAEEDTSTVILLNIDLEDNLDNTQLVASMACIIADSLQIQIPPGIDNKLAHHFDYSQTLAHNSIFV